MDELLRQWGSNIRFGRRALKLRQLDLAELVGVRQQTVAKWEAGLLAPRDNHKLALAAALHQDVRQLFPLIRVPA